MFVCFIINRNIAMKQLMYQWESQKQKYLQINRTK